MKVFFQKKFNFEKRYRSRVGGGSWFSAVVYKGGEVYVGDGVEVIDESIANALAIWFAVEEGAL